MKNLLHVPGTEGSDRLVGTHSVKTPRRLLLVAAAFTLALSTRVTGMDGHEHLPHPDDPGKQEEHLALFDLVPEAEATHRSVANGNWNDPATWDTGAIPGPGSRVLIEAAHMVHYNIRSDDPIAWVRVNGHFRFRPGANTRLVVEHLIVDPNGMLEVGSPASPIQPDRTAEIIIDTSGGPIHAAMDPLALGRGLISHGTTMIHGAEKLAFTTLRNQALAGENVIELSDTEIPLGWEIGDILVVAGTEANATPGALGQGTGTSLADLSNERFKDELLEIENLYIGSGGRVHVEFRNITHQQAIDDGVTWLLWDHRRPNGATFNPGELKIHVANLTRNVVLRSSDPLAPTQERGHFMVMHNPNAQIHHMLCKDLGRTDKSIVADDPEAIGNFDGSPSTGTNPRGRYGLHLHRVGASDFSGVRAEVTGNVVWGVPGWGIVHHDSYALLEDNVVFDTVGAGIVAEDGNEIGTWRNNLVIKATGAPGASFDDNPIVTSGRNIRFDLGFVGSGYWIQGGGAGLTIDDNVAASCNAAGFDIVPKTGLTPLPHSTFPAELIQIPQFRQDLLDAGIAEVAINAATTLPITGIQVYNSFRGIHTWLHKRDDGDKEHQLNDPPNVNHPYHQVIRDFKIWNVLTGIQNFYSQSMTFENGLVVGNVDYPVRYGNAVAQDNNVTGLGLSHNGGSANNLHFDQVRIEGFEYGLRTVEADDRSANRHVPYAVGSFRNSEIANVDFAYLGKRFLYPYFEVENNTISTLVPVDAPVATFTATEIGGCAWSFDATGSFDPDPHEEVVEGDPGLASYAWDFDGDGAFDAWGDLVFHNFGTPGTRDVTLTVFDTSGVTDSFTATLDVVAQPYPNLLVDSSFDEASGDVINTKRFASFKAINSRMRGEGWHGDHLVNAGGYLEAIEPPKLVQVYRDETITRGEQTLSLRLRNSSPGGTSRDVWVSVYGINGQFDFDQNTVNGDGPRPVANSILPMESTRIIHENLGGPNLSDWQDLTLNGDFGGGYEYIVVHISGDGHDPGAGDYFAIDDVTLTGESPAATDVALGRDARWGTHQTTWGGGKNASAIVDGDLLTGQGTHTGSRPYQWLGVDLGEVRTIEQVVHTWRDARHRAVDFEIEVSQDAETWSTVESVTGNGDLEVVNPIEAVQARYVRVKVSLSGFGPGGLETRVILMDLQVFGR